MRFGFRLFWARGLCLERLNKGQSANRGVTKGGIDAADEVFGLLVCLGATPTGDRQLQDTIACLTLGKLQLNRLLS